MRRAGFPGVSGAKGTVQVQPGSGAAAGGEGTMEWRFGLQHASTESCAENLALYMPAAFIAQKQVNSTWLVHGS